MHITKSMLWGLIGMLSHHLFAEGCVRIGHRGACGYEPENTLRSFKRAVELSVDMIELDVHLCASGEVVVIHDATLERTTNGTGRVADKTLVELKQLDAGKGEQIPTLVEAFECINRRAVINIELKGQATAHAVASLIEQYVYEKKWSYSDFLVSSFNHLELVIIQQLLPAVVTGALFEEIPARMISLTADCGARVMGVSQECITQEYIDIDDAHRRGLQVFVFTVNEPGEIAALKQLGVDGIVSDYPDRV
jgi:glycerophosphoryl diester phosphodiesterase